MNGIQNPREFAANARKSIPARRFPTEAERHNNGVRGKWLPGTGEPVMTVGGARVQYGWFPQTGYKCYYNLDTDLFMMDSEFEALRNRR